MATYVFVNDSGGDGGGLPEDATIRDLADVSSTTPQAGQVLAWQVGLGAPAAAQSGPGPMTRTVDPGTTMTLTIDGVERTLTVQGPGGVLQFPPSPVEFAGDGAVVTLAMVTPMGTIQIRNESGGDMVIGDDPYIASLGISPGTYPDTTTPGQYAPSTLPEPGAPWWAVNNVQAAVDALTTTALTDVADTPATPGQLLMMVAGPSVPGTLNTLTAEDAPPEPVTINNAQQVTVTIDGEPATFTSGSSATPVEIGMPEVIFGNDGTTSYMAFIGRGPLGVYIRWINALNGLPAPFETVEVNGDALLVSLGFDPAQVLNNPPVTSPGKLTPVSVEDIPEVAAILARLDAIEGA